MRIVSIPGVKVENRGLGGLLLVTMEVKPVVAGGKTRAVAVKGLIKGARGLATRAVDFPPMTSGLGLLHRTS